MSRNREDPEKKKTRDWRALTPEIPVLYSRRSLLAATSVAAAALLAYRFRRQKLAAAQPDHYVTVDRSGGGV